VVREREGSALVEISDKGPGMTPHFVEEELFTPFSSTKVHGLGIGMYQCRQQVERWGGSLEIDSAVGRGTTVRIALPLARARIRSRMDGFKIPA
jgi:signal transduction histidine kinase